MRGTTKNGIFAILCLFVAYLIQSHWLSMSIVLFLVGSVLAWVWFIIVREEDKLKIGGLK